MRITFSTGDTKILPSPILPVRAAGIATVVANLLFTVAAVVVVLARPVDLTTAGVVAVLAGGVYTLVFADLQYLGLRRMRR